MVANWVVGLPGKRDHGKPTRRGPLRGRCGDHKHPVPGAGERRSPHHRGYHLPPRNNVCTSSYDGSLFSCRFGQSPNAHLTNASYRILTRCFPLLQLSVGHFSSELMVRATRGTEETTGSHFSSERSAKKRSGKGHPSPIRFPLCPCVVVPCHDAVPGSRHSHSRRSSWSRAIPSDALDWTLSSRSGL
jgi:hypothetical protein